MLSYRHGFHAGGFSDVLKHITLIALLDYLNLKDKPYCYLDTHAGAGLYPLDHRFMSKTQEYETGIGKLLGQYFDCPALDRYLHVVASFNSEGKLKQYPGSPKIAQVCSRECDRLQLVELHSKEVMELRKNFVGSERARVYEQSAISSVLSFLPPKEKRGLVFIDPPYELEAEYFGTVELLRAAAERFPSGIYALWYPVIERRKTEIFTRKVSRLPFNTGIRIEHCHAQTEEESRGLLGSGMIVFNPPYTLKETLSPVLKILNRSLSETPGIYKITEFIPSSGNLE